MNDISTLPQSVSIDLDAAERPAEDVKPPFTVKINDKVITMKDPVDLDWRDLLQMQDPREFIRLTMSPEDRDHLSKTGFPGWKFAQLMEAFYRHYDLEELARQAQRDQALAPRGL